MGMPIATGGGRRRRQSADINVTPLVDVMLVLLVIFMITAPTLKEGFSVDLPTADATISINVADAYYVTLTPAGDVLRHQAAGPDDRFEKMADLVTALNAYQAQCAQEKTPPVVVIAADRETRYERVIQVWNAIRSAGVSQVSFQVEPGQTAAAR